MAVWDRQVQQVVSTANSKPKISIGIPHTETATFMWFMRMLAPLLYVQTNWCDKVPQMVRGVPQSIARDQIVELSLKDPNITHILWVDTDNICVKQDDKGNWGYLDPNVALNMLWQVNQPIVSGLYRAKQKEGFNYAAWMDANLPDRQGFTPIQSWTGNFFQVDVIGMGFCLVKREVYEKVTPPWHPWPTANPSEDFNFCVPKNTMIYGNEIKSIESINIGDKVLTCDGTIDTVTDTMVRDYTGVLKKITAFGATSIFTPNHPVLIKRGDLVSWVKSENVIKGDYIFAPRIKQDSERITSLALSDYVDTSRCSLVDGKVYYKRTHRNAPKILLDIKITKDLMRLFGYYIAEGCTGSGNGCIIFVFNQNEKTYAEDVISLLKELFGTTCTVDWTHNNVIRITCSSIIITDLFRYLFGHLAKNKHLPWFFNRLDDVCLGELIKGYWRGDGSKNGFGCTTVSKQLAHEVSMSLLRLGIFSYVKEGLSLNGKRYDIHISAKSKGDFSNKIGIGNGVNSTFKFYPWRNFFISESPLGFWLKVKQINDVIFNDKVYNISVQNSESYISEGIGVHNCIKAREVGYKVNVFADVKLSHIGMLNIFPDGKISVLEV